MVYSQVALMLAELTGQSPAKAQAALDAMKQEFLRAYRGKNKHLGLRKWTLVYEATRGALARQLAAQARG